MESRLHLDIAPQPDNNTCGPTCLQAIYNYYGDSLPLTQLIPEVPSFEEGGTLAVLLGCHALARGYSVSLYTYNLTVFDPTWFQPGGPPIADRLRAQMAVKDIPKLRMASQAYLEFLRLGGSLRMEDMTGNLIRRYLKRSIPVLAGLSATYLYNEPRESGLEGIPDDVNGTPQGHFVVLCGYDAQERRVLIADPMQPNPFSSQNQRYEVDLDRLMCAIMLGVVTYDSNLLVIQPKGRKDLPPASAPELVVRSQQASFPL
jgi:hypothetical protein